MNPEVNTTDQHTHQPADTHRPRPHSFIVKTARMLSAVFSPLIIPTYCTVLAMWLTPLSQYPEGPRFMASLIVFALTAAFPLLIILSMMRMGRVSNLDISRRSQRLLPLMMILVCYILATIYIYRQVHSGASSNYWWLVMYFVSGCVTTLAVALISTRWKISGHGAAMGNLVGMLAALIEGNHADVDLLPWLCTAILLAGAVGSARIILHRHTIAQVIAGIALSTIITAVLMTCHPLAKLIITN